MAEYYQRAIGRSLDRVKRGPWKRVEQAPQASAGAERASTESGGSRARPPSESASSYDMTAIEPFVFPGLRSRVVFGSGTLAQAAAEIERLGGKRALVLTTPPQEAQGRKLGSALGPLFAGIFPGAVMHTPSR